MRPMLFNVTIPTSLGKAAVYLTQHDEGPGTALEELIKKVQHAQGHKTQSDQGA
jgi:hypothetical protein